jgi:hypothetical protein
VKPIPLVDPKGRVRSYACGNCGNVATPNYHLGGVDEETIEEAAEDALLDAERCCRCRTCKQAVNLHYGVCDPCYEKWQAEEAAKPAPAPVELCPHHGYVGECDTCDEVAAAVAEERARCLADCEAVDAEQMAIVRSDLVVVTREQRIEAAAAAFGASMCAKRMRARSTEGEP